MKNLIDEINRVLKLFSGKLEGFYLAGGTALSMFYFHHRESYDLDFFSRSFDKTRINKIISEVSESAGLKMEQIGEQSHKDKARMLIYAVKTDEDAALKIDFVEDFYDLIKQPKVVDGIPVLSIEDIYLRKIYAVSGSFETSDHVGRKEFKGGRQDAKDFFDLYFLSTTFMPLSKFVAEYCNPSQMESIVIWYNKYERKSIKLGLNDIRTNKEINFVLMERHFKSEIEKIIKQGL